MFDTIIIGGGWSVSQFDVRDLRAYGHVVGVNEAAVLCKVDAGLTMDRLWAENRWHQLMTQQPSAELWIRDGADKALPYHPRRRKFWCDHRAYVLSDDFNTFNGTNSGLCAINYAYQRRPKRLFLFGFDMCKGPKKQPYWYPPYPWANPEGGTKPAKYVKWAEQFYAVADQLAKTHIEVFNVTTRSAIRAFPQISYRDFEDLVGKGRAEKETTASPSGA